MKAHSPLISASRSAQSFLPAPAGGMIGLYRAAEILANGRGHKGLIAARLMLESAGACGEISIVGEQEDRGHWTAAPLSRDDYYDLEFLWQDERVQSGTPAWGAFLVKAVPTKPAGQIGYLPVYWRLVIRESDLEKLTPRLSDWFSASQDQRARLAVTWWVNAPLCPPVAEPFPLPWWGQRLEIVKRIAECQGVPELEALQVLGTALQEIRRANGTDDADDREVLAAVHFMDGTDAEFFRLECRVRMWLRTELDRSPEACLLVLKLFDPDLRDIAAATAVIIDAAYTATAPLQTGKIIAPAVHAKVAAGPAETVAMRQTAEGVSSGNEGPKAKPILINPTAAGAAVSAQPRLGLLANALAVRADPAGAPHPKKMRGRPKGQRRYPSDEALINEGVEMCRTRQVGSALQAAGKLARRAEGPNFEAAVERLRKEISKRWSDLVGKSTN